MIGKIARAAAGRSMARKRGYSGASGAAAALIAPFAIKLALKGASKIAAKAADARRRRKGPEYLRRPLSDVH